MKSNNQELAFERTSWFGAKGFVDATVAENAEPRAGYYLFYDGRKVTYTAFEQEKGIFINQQSYIPLDCINPSLMNKSSVLAYCEKNNLRLPYLCELMPILRQVQGNKVWGAINAAFKAIQREDCVLPKNVLENCWFQEIMDEADDVHLRRLILVENLGEVRVSNSMIIDDGNCIVTPNGEVWVKKGGLYQPTDFIFWSAYEGLKLLLVEDLYIFRLQYGTLSYIGMNPRRAGEDVLLCSSGVYQLRSDGLRLMQLSSGNVSFDEWGQLLIQTSDEFYGGSEQWIHDVDVDYYKKTNGLWEHVGHHHHS